MATKVSVGVTSAAGYGATLVGLIATVLAMVWPDVPHEEIALLAAAVFTIGSFLVTQLGRYVQAREQIRQGYGKGVPAPPEGAKVLDFEEDDPEPPGGPDPSIADPLLDDPRATPSHQGLKG